MIWMLLVEHTHPDLVFVAYYMKLELTWIIANLTYGSDHLCLDILTEGPINDSGQRKLSSVVEFLSKALEGDNSMKELATHVYGNLMVSDFNIAKMLLEQTQVV